MSKKSKRLQKISRRLTTHQLRRLQEKDVALSYEDLFGTGEKNSTPYFLGYYSPSGIRYALEKYGFFDILKKKGYDNFKVSINTQDPYKQRIAVYFDKKAPNHLLGELVVKRKHITVYPPFPSRIHGRDFEMISVEWLCMQHPRGQFKPEKPRLPGQKYPGLGLGAMIMELLVIMCGRLRTAGLLNVPEYFHNAQMYTPQFRYLDPGLEGRRMAIQRDLLTNYSLSQVSWAIDMGCVEENGEPFKWFVGEQVIPLDRDLKEYFEGKDYLVYAHKVAAENRYTLNIDKWNLVKDKLEDHTTC
ncbi:MAG: hypothetical protein Kow0037_30200 [Calditrichia bacterium]